MKDLEWAFGKYQIVSQNNQKINQEHRALLHKYFNNIVLYSAGSITLSATINSFTID